MSAGYIDKLRCEIENLKSALAESIELELENEQTIESLEIEIEILKERLAHLEGQPNE